MNVFCPHFGGLRSLFQGNMTLGVDMAILKQLLGVMDYCYEYLWQKRDKFSLRPGALSNIFTDPLWWAKFHGKTFGGQSRADTHQYYAANRLVTLVEFQALRDPLLIRWKQYSLNMRCKLDLSQGAIHKLCNVIGVGGWSAKKLLLHTLV